MDGDRLEVTEEILDRVVYGMENQKVELFLDPADGQLKEEGPERRTLIPMPEWTPSDGFRLMDSFVATLPDTPFRRSLLDILHSGQGVFRRFKDELRQRPGTEGIWRRFKQREMRKTALTWLSRWSEALALEELGEEPESFDDLSLSDFSFRRGGTEDLDFAGNCLAEAGRETEGFLPLPKQLDPQGLWIAEAPGPLPVGCGCLSFPGDGRDFFSLDLLYVQPDFRGLGIGRQLTETVLDSLDAEPDGIRLITGDAGSSTRLWLESMGFVSCAILWARSGRN